eukprot:Skav226802  [mRNA]  locus=scaffold2056:42969:43190:- [translate_table: standard]
MSRSLKLRQVTAFALRDVTFGAVQLRVLRVAGVAPSAMAFFCTVLFCSTRVVVNVSEDPGRDLAESLHSLSSC